MKVLLLLTFMAVVVSTTAERADKCGTMEHLRQRIIQDPSLKTRMDEAEQRTQEYIAARAKAMQAQQVITIPVVVHVVWNKPEENISTQQVLSQIEVLNRDFRWKNSDTLPSNHPFRQFAADARIEFCLASKDPLGNPTDGITRTRTDSITFSGESTERRTATGGRDGWDPTRYMNLWVCKLQGTTLGYASFPEDLVTKPNEDGVTIRFEAFGTSGSAVAPNHLGRTGTHEVGHWLNLRHIWGDNQPNCGDDFVADTPPADSMNYGCPTFPHKAKNKCIDDEFGNMYMNYMDYVDDSCMNMFTNGQIARMHAALNGPRIGLLSSEGCSSTTSIAEQTLSQKFAVQPNPTNGRTFTVVSSHAGVAELTIYTMLGEKAVSIDGITAGETLVRLPELQSGLYFICLKMASGISTTTIFIAEAP